MQAWERGRPQGTGMSLAGKCMAHAGQQGSTAAAQKEVAGECHSLNRDELVADALLLEGRDHTLGAGGGGEAVDGDGGHFQKGPQKSEWSKPSWRIL